MAQPKPKTQVSGTRSVTSRDIGYSQNWKSSIRIQQDYNTVVPTTTKNKWVRVYADVCYFFPLKMAFGFSRDLKCSRDFQTSQRVTFQEIKVSLFLSGIWICMNSRQNYRHSIIKIQIKCNFPILYGTFLPFLKPCAHPPIFHSLKFSN